MSRINIWQCKDWCCEDRPHRERYWMARSSNFEFYEQVPSWATAIALTERHVRTRTKRAADWPDLPKAKS